MEGRAGILAILAAIALFAPPVHAYAPAELRAPTLNCAESRCKILLGASDGEQPRLADLIADIVLILDAPEHVWVKAKDRPPATVTLKVAEFLRRCWDKVMTLKHFVLHHCLSKAQAPEIPIVQRPISWPKERERLMAEYMKSHTGDSSTTLRNPTTIVLHWTGGWSDDDERRMAKGNIKGVDRVFNTFEPTKLLGRPSLKKAGAVNVSCHFVVDRDGTIYQLMPTDRTARHAVGMNRDSICVENVGSDKMPLTQEQLDSNEQLIAQLVAQNPTIESVIGHAEYRGFEDTYLFKESDPKYRSDRKDEPGKAFMSKLRQSLFATGEDVSAAGRCQ